MAAVAEASRPPVSPEAPKVGAPAGGEQKIEGPLQRLKRKAMTAFGRGEVNSGKPAAQVLEGIASGQATKAAEAPIDTTSLEGLQKAYLEQGFTDADVIKQNQEGVARAKPESHVVGDVIEPTEQPAAQVDAAKTPVDIAAVRAAETQRDQDMAAFIREKAGEAQKQTDAILASRQGMSGEPTVVGVPIASEVPTPSPEAAILGQGPNVSGQESGIPSLAESQEAAEADAHAKNESVPPAEVVEATVAVPKTPEDAGKVIAEVQDEVFQEQYDTWQKDWVESVYKAHIEQGKVLDAAAEGRFAIPQAKGMVEDPAYQRIFQEEINKAQLEGRVTDRAGIFRSTIIRYKAGVDAKQVAEIQQKRKHEQEVTGVSAGVEQPGGAETAVVRATREVVAGRGDVGEGADQANGPTETLQQGIAREVADGMTFAGVNRVIEGVYDKYVAENPDDARHYAESDPNIQAALDRQEAKTRETTPSQSEEPVGVTESTVQRTESVEPPLTPREQAMQARIDALEAKLEFQSKAMEKMAGVLQEMLEKQLAEAKTDEEKKGINALMLLLMGLGFIGSSVTEGVTE